MLRRIFMNLSIKYKILIFFYCVIIVIATMLGLYSLTISRRNIISQISTSNIGVNKQLNSHINFMLSDITDISTNICIDDNVQSLLKSSAEDQSSSPDMSLITNDSLKFIINMIASKSYISFLVLYGAQDNPLYYEFTDSSTGVKGFNKIRNTDLYNSALSLHGSPLPFYVAQGDNMFIQFSTYPKIGICRIVKNFTANKPVGFLMIGFNESTLKDLCQSNIQNFGEGVMVTDGSGNVLSQAGPVFASGDFKNQGFYLDAQRKGEGYTIGTVGSAKYLITYSSMANGWKSFYAVPMANLMKEINSINGFTVIVVLAALALSVPLVAFISSFLTAPLTSLLKSMKQFQQGNFDEHVEFRYNDEIGQLGEGYNNMVRSIKELIDKAYVLQIREREAELNALQAQINPHFLYNTLDAIFWKAEMRKEKEISEMVYSLSRLFRLSLNRGDRLTSVSNEKEMLAHYLLLQKIRLKKKLDYSIRIDDEIMPYVIPKLMLQPFVENAILHGLDGKEEGGFVKVSATREGEKLCFTIEDDGIGMDPDTVERLLKPGGLNAMTGNAGTSGYAVGNVNERLKLIYMDSYGLTIDSEMNKGTKVTILIPIQAKKEGKEAADV